eukprot:2612197-Prymnesium_polylepis.1
MPHCHPSSTPARPAPLPGSPSAFKTGRRHERTPGWPSHGPRPAGRVRVGCTGLVDQLDAHLSRRAAPQRPADS